MRSHTRPNLIHTLLAVCALSLALGCAEESGDGPTFAFADHFDPSQVEVEELEGATLLRFETVGFRAGTAEPTPDSLAVLDQLAAVFEALPGARYSVEGHTDSAGAEAANQALSEDRAEVVRDYLVDVLGAPPVAFTTIGYGETRPIDTNRTAAGRARNRRIEIIVEDDPGDPIFDVVLSADRLDVTLDCDDFTSSASAAAGDFYIQTELDSDDDRGRVLVDRSANTLVQLDAGESSEPDIVAAGRFLTSDVAVLTGFVDWYENDSGGVRQFDLTEAIHLFYDTRERCWVDVDLGDDCIDTPDGVVAAGTLSIVQPPTPSVDGCVADLDWSLRVERVR